MKKTPPISQQTPAPDISVLLAQIESLAAQNASLEKDVANLSADVRRTAEENGALRKELAQANKTIEGLIEHIRVLNQQHFGSKSEKVVPGQLSLFNDHEAAADPRVPEPALPEALNASEPRKRGGKRTVDWSKYETVVIEHGLDGDARGCPECGERMDEMNVEITRRLRIVPAHLVVEEHRRHVYRCARCCGENAAGGEGRAVIVRASQPEPPIPGSFATPSLLSYIINAKYVNAMPLYRTEQDFRALGVTLSRQNMANWMMNVHARWFSLIYERMVSELLSHPRMHADETPVQVLKEPNREAKSKSRMWLFCAARCDVPVYIYRYDETRSKAVAQDFLRGWSGTLTTDGYKPYFNLGIAGIANTACLVHVRRKFVEVITASGGEGKVRSAPGGSAALAARRKIDEMFDVDSAFDGMEPERRRLARDEKLRPLMESFVEWAREQLALASPGLKLHAALSYAVEYWPYVMNVLADGHLELSNNIAERAIKPFVIGRKNWLFSDTPRGAEASAAIYSVVTTAKMNGLNPRAYAEWLLEEMPNAGRLTDEVLDGFLPWSEKVPDKCRYGEKARASAMEMKDDPIIDADEEIFRDEGEEQ